MHVCSYDWEFNTPGTAYQTVHNEAAAEPKAAKDPAKTAVQQDAQNDKEFARQLHAAELADTRPCRTRKRSSPPSSSEERPTKSTGKASSRATLKNPPPNSYEQSRLKHIAANQQKLIDLNISNDLKSLDDAEMADADNGPKQLACQLNAGPSIHDDEQLAFALQAEEDASARPRRTKQRLSPSIHDDGRSIDDDEELARKLQAEEEEKAGAHRCTRKRSMPVSAGKEERPAKTARELKYAKDRGLVVEDAMQVSDFFDFFEPERVFEPEN